MEDYLGMININAGNKTPKGWLPCDGRQLEIEKHKDLFSLLGNSYGGDGWEFFCLPDYRGRVPIGRDSYVQLGEQVGQEEVVLTDRQHAVHNHSFMVSDTLATTENPTDGTVSTANYGTGRSRVQTSAFSMAAPDVTMPSNSIVTAGEGEAHANIQPFLAVNYIICIAGAYPPRS